MARSWTEVSGPVRRDATSQSEVTAAGPFTIDDAVACIERARLVGDEVAPFSRGVHLHHLDAKARGVVLSTHEIIGGTLTDIVIIHRAAIGDMGAVVWVPTVIACIKHRMFPDAPGLN